MTSHDISFYMQRLRDLKQEIEHLQRLVEEGRIKMQADFDAWLDHALTSATGTTALPAPQPPSLIAATFPGFPTSTHTSTISADTAEADIALFYRAREELLSRKLSTG
jgi:kinesin family protein 6/9